MMTVITHVTIEPGKEPAWEAWYATDVFKRTRADMEGVQIAERETWWHEVVPDEHR